MATKMVLAVWPLCTILGAVAARSPPVSVQLNITAVSREIESGWTSVYYPDAASNSSPPASPFLIGNDGMTATGGFHIFNLDSPSPISEVASIVTGRTKLVTTLYGLGGWRGGKGGSEDVIVTIAQTDSIIRVFDTTSFNEIPTLASPRVTLGDWNAICPWQSSSGNHYFFLFGKGGRAFQYLVRKVNGAVEILEVNTCGSQRGVEEWCVGCPNRLHLRRRFDLSPFRPCSSAAPFLGSTPRCSSPRM